MLNVVGGCCGTTDKHIAKMAQLVEPVSGLFVSPKTGERLKEKFVSLKADESIKELTSAFSHSSPS